MELSNFALRTCSKSLHVATLAEAKTHILRDSYIIFANYQYADVVQSVYI